MSPVHQRRDKKMTSSMKILIGALSLALACAILAGIGFAAHDGGIPYMGAEYVAGI